MASLCDACATLLWHGYATRLGADASYEQDLLAQLGAQGGQGLEVCQPGGCREACAKPGAVRAAVTSACFADITYVAQAEGADLQEVLRILQKQRKGN